MKTNIFFKKIICASAAVVMLLTSVDISAQSLPQEVEERGLDALARDAAAQAEFKEAPKGKFTKHLKLNYGYDSNPLLSKTRRDDTYESMRLGMNYRRTFAERHQYALALNVTQQNYNEITQLSNTLGNVILDYKLALTKKYIFGAGNNLSAAYYDKSEDSEFLLNKSYINFQHRVSSKFFHKIQYEFSVKHYDEALALKSSASDFKNNRRKDLTSGVVYSIGYTMGKRFSINTSFKYSRTDANSDFQNYYDYDAYDVGPRVYYKITDALTATLAYGHKYKRYKDRVVRPSDEEQIDRIGKAELGLTYKLNDRHTFTLNYAYNNNASNNITSDYTGNSIEAGWRFDF